MGEADLVIWRAVAADEAAVRACVVAAYSHYIARRGVPPGPMRQDYAALIAQGLVYVLVATDGIRGLVVTTPHEGNRFLANIAVAPCDQGQGLGRRLLGFVGERARAEGRDAITPYTNAVTTEKIALYRRLGFVETARRAEHGFRRVYMRKMLTAGAAS